MTATATENVLDAVAEDEDVALRAQEDIVEELVVEEISIDGMCGVY